MPKLEYDAEANAAYLRFSDAAVADSEELTAGIILDYDSEGKIVALEILSAREHLSPEVLSEAA